NTFYAKGFYQWKWKSFWNNSVQIEHKYSTGHSTENPLKNISQHITDVSWFHSLKWNENLKGEFGIKKEWSNVFKNPFLYSAAVEWKPNQWTLGISTSKNYRTPSFNDLFWEPGGNKNLNPETSYQNEIHINYKSSHSKVQINAYHNKITDMIRWVPTSSGYWMAENTDKVNISGVEAAFAIGKKHKQWNWNFDIQYAFTQAINKDTKLQLMYVPKHKITSQFHTSYKRWEFVLQALHLDRVYSTSDEDIAYALPAYLTFDAQVGYFLNQTKKWHTQAGVYNLNNKLYYAMPDRPMPHRNFTIKLTYTFYIMKKHILSLFVAISLVACSNDHKTVTEQPANYSTGYLVTNEGNFHSNNADITYINANFTDSQNQIFRNVNNRALGDVAQSITQNANYVFVVMNNSNTIEVVNKNTFESVATISENINQPRYATITDNKLWVTNAGNNTISSYNLSDFT